MRKTNHWRQGVLGSLMAAALLTNACNTPQVPQENPPETVPASSAEILSSQPASLPSQPEENPKENIPEENWSHSYDVVVIGFGGAGQAAALAAAEEGASVLILEKAPESAAGGNTRVCGQQILSPTDIDTAIDYFDKIFEGYHYDQGLLEATVKGMNEIGGWLMELGGPELDLQEITYPEYPEIAGSETMRCYLIDGERSTGKLWYLLKDCIQEKESQIQVWYESPALELIQDPDTREITGVLARHDGQDTRIQAKNGVVMACGGYENNQEMIQNYLHMEYAYPKGSWHNTGDGIVMAMKVGADLWHMNNPAGPDLNFVAPDSHVYYGYSLATGFGSRSTIYVGPDGTRFINEALMTRHGKMPAHGNYQTAPTVFPAYAVFDQASYDGGPVTTSGGWSSDNSQELEKGWIVKADTLSQLAQQIGVDEEGLEKTWQRYNFYCSQGEDYEFGRSAATLTPLSETGPYYAIKLSPTLTNTQGGPVRNANCEVVDLDGYAIPHLYSAGEFGSMYVHGYNGGGNVGEALASGRIAGTNAAQSDKSQIPVISAGKKSDDSSQTRQGISLSDLTLKDGTYTGNGNGMGGQLAVEIVINQNHLGAL